MDFEDFSRKAWFRGCKIVLDGADEVDKATESPKRMNISYQKKYKNIKKSD